MGVDLRCARRVPVQENAPVTAAVLVDTTAPEIAPRRAFGLVARRLTASPGNFDVRHGQLIRAFGDSGAALRLPRNGVAPPTTHPERDVRART
jgi:hypothetical protein